MKKSIVFILSMMTALLSAQEIHVDSFKENPFYNLTDSEIQKDGNGDICALIKIYFQEQNALFEGAYVIGSTSANSYYQVFLAGGASKVVVKHNDYLPISIVFADYGIKKLESNKMYEIKLIGDKTQNAFSKELIDNDFEVEANRGNAEAQYNLGKLYYIGIDDEPDFEKAIYWFKKSAEQGYINAIYNLGICYYYGQGVEQNHDQAKEYFRIAANSGHAMAQYKLANCLYFNKGNKEEILEAIMWFERAASQNILAAKNNVATIYLFYDPTNYLAGTSDVNMVGFPEYFEKGIAYLKECTDAGITEACYNLGNVYSNGIAIEKDFKVALEYYQKALENGSVIANIDIGKMYYNGNGVKQDYKKAFEYFEKAAEKGVARGLYNVALCYQLGKGIKRNYKKAVANYEKAVEQNYILAEVNLGNMYREGLGVKKDLKKAFDLFTKAAESGEPNGYTNIGLMYNNGEYVSKDINKAIAYYEKAAEMGNYAGLINLAVMYQNGNGVPVDAYKAVEYYERACKIDKMGQADYNLGTLYYWGCGTIQRDYYKAFKQFEKSAKVGYAPAKYNLGIMYLNGEYVKKSEGVALMYIKQAAKQKYQLAVNFMYRYNAAKTIRAINNIDKTQQRRKNY